MTLYINEDTNEYPRYQGDVDLNPDAAWSIVDETPIPEDVKSGMMWIEDLPIKDETGWKRTWKEIPIPVRTKADEILRAKQYGIDLELLGVVEE